VDGELPRSAAASFDPLEFDGLGAAPINRSAMIVVSLAEKFGTVAVLSIVDHWVAKPRLSRR
jgi:hypothetical protein